MAENKKSFILYSDQQETVEALTDEEAGKLLKHLYKYVNDENPICNDKFVNIAFISIKQSLKRDLKKWESKQLQRKEAGKKSAEARKKNADEAKRKATTVNDRSISSTVSDSVNVSVSDINNSSSSDEVKKLSNDETFEIFWDHFHKETTKPKEKKSPTFKHWKKLTLDEQRKAYNSVKAFSNSNTEKQYLPIARTYLSDKVFNDEFVVGKAQPKKAETYEQTVARTQPNQNYTF